MTPEENAIAVHLLQWIRTKFPLFEKGFYRITAGSAVNISFAFKYELYDTSGSAYKDALFINDLINKLLITYFIAVNQTEKCNVIECIYEKENVRIFRSWDQAEQDSFESYLPKKSRGKFIAWYRPGSDYVQGNSASNTDELVKERNHWQPIGQLLEEFEIQYLSPIHHGYTAWPGDRILQLWKTTWNTYISCTQGLYHPNDELSLGFELYMETVDMPEPFGSSWQANIVYELGKLLPSVPDLPQRLEDFTYLSVQVAMKGAPDEWSLPEQDNIGILLGIPHEVMTERGLQFPFKPMNAKLLRPAETRMIKKLNANGRAKLVNFFRQKGGATLSSLDRPSAVNETA